MTHALGRVTTGIDSNGLVAATLRFVGENLMAWRDHAGRPVATAEEALNGQLCKYLNAVARHSFPMVSFSHEERQGPRRKVDLAAGVSGFGDMRAISEAIYEPFLVLEGKRLPMPGSKRQHEYLTGFQERSGGIQRFKLGLHGAALPVAAIIGYLQSGSSTEWFRQLNEWIAELSSRPIDEFDSWTTRECLGGFTPRAGGGAESQSVHPRTSGSPIRLVHLWVEMATGSP